MLESTAAFAEALNIQLNFISALSRECVSSAAAYACMCKCRRKELRVECECERECVHSMKSEYSEKSCQEISSLFKFA